jgi:integrase
MPDEAALGVNCVSLFESALQRGGWRLRASSIAVYRSMWRKFETLARSRGIPVERPTCSELEELVYAAYPDSENTAHKLFRVVLKVYEHSGPEGANGFAAAKDIEYRFFEKTPVARTAFIPPTPEALPPVQGWKKTRGVALQACVRSAAPRLGELRGLLYRDVVVTPDKVTLVLGRGRSKRTVSLDAASAEGVALSRFHSSHPSPLPTSAFFCADEDGKALNAATLYRQTKAFTASAGVEPEHHGTGAFRASLARKMLDEGRSVEEIRQALGHRLISSTEEFLKHITQGAGTA